MEEADTLIAGGGSAGSVLASRLSEDPGRKVILVEAGMDCPPDAVPEDISDVFPRAYANPAYFWPDLKAVARAGSSPRPYTQARMLGGGSQVMGMWAVRGLAEDYDNWREAGAIGWAWDDVLPVFKRLERDLDIASLEHGNEGRITIQRVPPANWPGFNKALAEAAQKRQLRLLPDLNSSEIDGVFSLPLTIEENARLSTARAYLTPEVRRRPNLQILTRCEVAAVAFEGRRAVGVRIRREDGSTALLRAHQVIVSAGGIHSPALLMRSGIGEAAALARSGIPLVHDLPAVGRNLQNHLFTHLGAVIRPQVRQSPSLRIYAMAGARLSSGTGPAGDIFVSFISRTSSDPTGNRLGMVGPSLYAPFSRGSVTLDPANPHGEPLVDFNLLSDPRDAARLADAARFARDLLMDESVRAATFESFVLPPNPPIRLLNRPGPSAAMLNKAIAALVGLGGPVRRAALRRILAPGKLLTDIRDEREFEALALAGATPMFHPTSTCGIGAVVDPAARVYGVDNLRVVDASIMPTIPRANTNIPTIMLAEKCAAAISAE